MARRRIRYELEIGHRLIRSAVTRVIVCGECGATCVSYEEQVAPCPKLSVRAA